MGINVRSELSPYLSAASVKAGPVVHRVDEVGLVELDGQDRIVVKFVGEKKGLVLNKGNANVICDAYGDDSDGWIGRQIELYYDPNVVYRGKRVGGIKVRIPEEAVKE